MPDNFYTHKPTPPTSEGGDTQNQTASQWNTDQLKSNVWFRVIIGIIVLSLFFWTLNNLLDVLGGGGGGKGAKPLWYSMKFWYAMMALICIILIYWLENTIRFKNLIFVAVVPLTTLLIMSVIDTKPIIKEKANTTIDWFKKDPETQQISVSPTQQWKWQTSSRKTLGVGEHHFVLSPGECTPWLSIPSEMLYNIFLPEKEEWSIRYKDETMINIKDGDNLEFPNKPNATFKIISRSNNIDEHFTVNVSQYKPI